MKFDFFADVNIEKPIMDYLKERGHDVLWVGDVYLQMIDEDIITISKNDKRIILTNDKDFGELTFLKGQASEGIILFRVKGQSVKEKIILLEQILNKFSDKIRSHFIVIKREKLRFIKL